MKISFSQRLLGAAITIAEFLLLLGLLRLTLEGFSTANVLSKALGSIFIVGGIAIVLRSARELKGSSTNGQLLGSFKALPNPRRNGALATEGPYRYVRHPVYLGLLVAGLGTILIAASWVSLYCWGTLALTLYWKATIEDGFLGRAYSEHVSYRSRVSMAIPKIKNPR